VNMDTLLKDLRYAIRLFVKRPGFTAIAIITLALGIGANSAIFSVVNAIVLRPLPYRNPERLMVVWGNLNGSGIDESNLSVPEFNDLRAQSSSFEQLAAYDEAGFNLTGFDQPERLPGALVSASFFPALGVTPQYGRGFLEQEDQFEHDQVVILSHALWQRRFGGDLSLVNRTITLDGQTVTVVGIMAPEFHFPNRETQIWKPIAFSPELQQENNRGSHFLDVIARLKRGVSIDQARADLSAITARLTQEHSSNYPRGLRSIVRPLHEELVGDLRRSLFILLGAVGLVLAVACANVAHLLLANSASRHKEIAVRSALGANRGRVIRQLLTESLLLSGLGGVAGLALAVWGVQVLVALIPQDTPRLEEIRLDYRVVLFTLGISLATGLLFGLAPALQSARTDLNETLKESGRGGSDGRSRLRLRNLLAVSEFALALVLLIGAGLMLKSFRRLQDVRPGFEPSHLLTMRVALPDQKYPDFNKSKAFFDQLFERLKTLPEIKAAGAVNLLPFSGSNGDRTFTIEGRPIPEGQPHPDEQVRFVSPGYFGAMEIPFLTGRDFTARDLPDTPQVVIVNQAMVQKFWPNESPIGKRMSFSRRNPKWYEVVGVVGNIKHRGLDLAEKPEIYLPVLQPLFAEGNLPTMFLVVRTSAEPGALAPTLRNEVLAIDKDQPLSSVLTMDQRISDSVAPRRFNMFLLGLFAALALVLAAIGIYGIMTFSVAQRTHEIGIRMALGAGHRDVLKLVLRNGIGLAVIGIGIGLAVALAVTRLMSTLLFQVSPTDPLTFVIDALLLGAVAVFACYIPARRATRVDPLEALRYE
jgi:putative ABC transport system permease protein